MITDRRSLWHEPRPADAPTVGRLDWLLAGAFAAVVLVEGIVRPGVELRPLVILLALTVAPALLLRRRIPLGAAVLGWSGAGLLSILQRVTHTADLGLYSMMAILVLLYSLVRWGSGREVALGTAFVAVVVALGMYVANAGLAQLLGGTVYVLAFVALAAVFRYRADIWQRRLTEIRNQERLGLARELHDTVAHHISAIAVQAQAGRVVAGVQPEKATDVLGAIESEASQALAEMRSMVRVLREDDDVAYAPQRGVADLPALARTGPTPRVEVTLTGTLTGLAPAVESALFRLAQESLTNATRHARGAARVAIDVRREGDAVRLRVTDDGSTEPGSTPEHGFGLRGMTERAHLLGGSLTAGPGPGGGWVVEAMLPAEELR